MNEDISLLICKQLVGNITADEQRVLDEWRQQNKYNEAAYQRLHDPERLLVEHHRDRMTNYERPLADMKQRISPLPTSPKGEERLRHRWMWWAAAAVAGFIAGLSVWWQLSLSPEVQDTVAQTPAKIHPGTTQATLTLSSGETIELSNDTLYPRRGHTTPSTEVTSSELATLTTPRGGEFRVVLEDGTEVWLNAATRLVYPEVFDAKERRVELEGEAYFKVAKNEAKPFVVMSGEQEVRVLGTEFNVRAYSDETDIYTTLVEGSVSLRLAGDNLQGRELQLTPNHQTIFNHQHAAFNIKEVDTEVVTSWRNGVFVFEDQTLEQIMRTLSRWYDFDYEFQDRHTAETVFMGSIPRYSSFDDVCHIFHKLGGIRLKQRGHKVIISAK